MKENKYYSLILNKSNELIMYYDILKTKELENRKGDLEYNNALFQIARLRKEEDKLYDELFSGVNTKDEIIELSSTIAGIAVGELSNFDLLDKKSILEPISVIFGNKLPNEFLVAMRITTKLLEISKKKCMHEILIDHYGENSEEELDTYNIYSSLESRVDKKFLDIIDSHIDEAKDFEEIRRMYIDAKYSYAFVRSDHESEICFDEEDYSKKMIYSVAAIPKILEYAIRLSGLNKPTLTHKSNQRRIMLESDYVRALVLQLDDLSFDTLLSTINEEIKKGTIKNDFGMQVFNNILSFRDEDIERFNNDNLELKRLF